MIVTQGLLDRLVARRANVLAEADAYMATRQPGKREGDRRVLSPGETATYMGFVDTIRDLDEQTKEVRSELERMGRAPVKTPGGLDSRAYARQWSQRVADQMSQAMGGGAEGRAVVSGSLDIPQFIEPEVIPMARPQRLIDLFTNRITVESNSFEYYQQSARTNLATAVADGNVKPTSTLTVTPHTDRCRVVAHLSEPAPIRLWHDIEAFTSWLTSEMVEGVLDGLEAQIVSGSGTGENMLGLLNTAGTTAVPFTTDVVTTLRSAVTALQTIGEQPTGWALNPADAQTVDMLRWNTAGGFLSGGYEHDPGTGFGSSSNIFGPDVKRVVSPSVPQGTAILGDFTKLRVYVREDAHIDVDASGVLFTKNQFIARGEGRFGIGVLRPSAFAIATLHS
ncbi:phage major capsid protein [Mycolicibacterium fluoranthenivorans]|uniref:Phage major capsid protein n=1 Tax=Mycolicibacterium fluoranthenivorans TaxID=258505 RepID=A0A7G8PJI6_9MYCO|nr:phage major capsid protein [Mycolicibacterium fluoranthenivorans]QNJ91524.1 phage major capsid protein [Mycolicibacterium fluoranthenivorans]QNJ94502.1 phage major capsid protein [Mycolicibacterium fluoranthenivorans]